jgi:hypothetical protein
MKIAGWERTMSRKPRKRLEYVGVRLLQNRRGPKQKRMSATSRKPYREMGSAIRKGDLVHTRSEWIAATAFLGLMLAYDPGQSTGPGTHQDNDAATSSQRGGTTDSKSSKNEDSGSATGAVRDRSHTGMESGSSHGSGRPDETGRSMKESGSGTMSGASKSRK